MTEMTVEYVDHMGSDRTVVNAARVSFNKHKDYIDESDVRLIQYLANHNHWTPFSHASIQLRLKTPIFVARQLFKHKVGMTENEVSRRYVDDEPEFYVPSEWRSRPTGGAKQGSSDGVVEFVRDELGSYHITDTYKQMLVEVTDFYNDLIKGGVAPEQARMVLPQSMMTEWYWTGSLYSYARIYGLRSDSHAQKETQEIAKKISDIIEPLYPYSWDALINSG